MKKYKNLSGKDVGFIIDGKTLDFQNGQVLEVPDNFKENVESVISKLEEIVEKPEPVAPERPAPAEKPKPFSRSALFRMRKGRQVSLLESLGAKVIPKREADRVKRIMSLQKEG